MLTILDDVEITGAMLLLLLYRLFVGRRTTVP